MYSKSIFVASSALISFVAAVPMNKRELVWVTEVVEDVVTIPVTTTVWVNPGEATAAAKTTVSAAEHYGHHGHFSRSSSTSTVQSTVTIHPAAPYSVGTSAPVAPVQSTTSVSVAVDPVPTSTSVYHSPVPTTTSVYVAPIPTSTYIAPVSTSTYIAPVSTSTYVAPVPTSTYVAPVPTSTYAAPAPTTSTYVAPVPEPTTSTSVYVAPTPTSTSTWEAPTTTTASAPAATSAYSSSGGVSALAGTTHSGDMTYYAVGMGACGVTSTDNEAVVAVSHILFDQYTPNGNPNNNPLCGSKVIINGTPATIVDRCVGCAMYDLDLSTGLWAIVEPNGDGRVHGVSWSFA